MQSVQATAQKLKRPHLQYGADPFDLRPFVKAIMDAENMILDRIPPDQKLVRLMGENHYCHTHKLLLQAIMLAHKQTTHRTSLGLEFPNDIDWLNLPWPPAVNDRTASYIAVFRFCQTQNIDVQFNDLARKTEFSPDGLPLKQTSELDFDDEKTANIIRKHGLPPDFSIDAGTRLGMRLRNIGIVENAISHIKKSDARVYVQHCGNGHLFGSRYRDHPYEESLTSLFHQRGFAVLAVCSHIGNGPDDWPHDALKDVADVIAPANMADGHALNFSYDIVRQRVNAASGYDL